MTARARFGLFGALVLLATLSLLFAAAARERSALPGASQRLLQATFAASAVTTCLGGVQDELYVTSGRLHTHVAKVAALSRLRSCDVAPLERAVDRVDLPPKAPVDQKTRHRAYDRVAQGVALLRRVVVDTRGAARAMQEDVTGRQIGSRVVLVYRSASQGSDAAYAQALRALALLGETPGTTR